MSRKISGRSDLGSAAKRESERKEDSNSRAKVARDILPDELRKAGAVVDVVEVYETVRPQENVDEIRDLLKKKAISAITFTSSSTVSNFVEMVGRKEARELTAGIPVASIGPITMEKARSLGIETAIMPEEYTIPALVQALADYFKKNSTAEIAENAENPRGKKSQIPNS